MAQLALTLLGRFQVVLGQQTITAFESDKVRALLAYLAVELPRTIHNRSSLAALLWPGYSEESARASLRQTLHHLRKTLGEESRSSNESQGFLLVTRQTIQFNPAADCKVDVWHFTQLLADCATHPHTQLAECDACIARFRQIDALYQGDFLGTFAVDDSAPFEEWRRIKQEQFHVAALDVFEQLTTIYEAKGDLEQACHFAERQIALEPWREQAHRQLMVNLARRGRRGAAIAQYHTCRQILLDEFGSEPESLTSELYEQIRAGKVEQVAGGKWQGDFRTPRVNTVQEIGWHDNDSTELAEVSAELPPKSELAAAKSINTPVTEQVPTGREATPSPPHPLTPSPLPPFSPAPPQNLPPPLTSLIGRAELIDTIQGLLNASRLVTLTGVGGVGKTSLALQVGHNLLNQYEDGVWLVELAPLSQPELLAATVATTLGLRESSDARSLDTLISYLQPKSLLLLIDNCEHLIAATRQLCNSLLTSCPQLHILATSRQALQLPQEQIQLVPPLAAPATLPPLAELQNFAAVQLFVMRVRDADPTFALTEQNASAVLQICQRLDGLPLALELAAARARFLTAEEIASRLTQRLNFLRTRNANRETRQQTLRDTIDWGYELLSTPEQTLFRRLAVFTGGFTIAAAEAVASEEVLDLLDALVDKSFVVHERNTEGSRFYLLETLREYAQEKLDAAGENTDARRRHLSFYLEMAETAERHYTLPTQFEWFRRLDDEHDNLRAAISWALSMTGDEGVAALRLTSALGRFWEVRGYIGEAKQALQNALERATLDAAAGSPTLHPATRWRAKALLWMGGMIRHQSDYVQAKTLLQESLALYQSLGDQRSIALALTWLGVVWDDESEYEIALRHYKESYDLFYQLGDAWGIAVTLNNRSSMAFLQGDYLTARQLSEESIAYIRKVGDPRQLANFLTTLAEAAQMLNDFATAHQSLAEALSIHTRNGDKLRSALTLCSWADVDRMQGNLTQARRRYVQSVTLTYSFWERRRLAISFEGVAHCTAALGDPATAVRFWSVAAALRTTIGSPLPPSQAAAYETTLAAAKKSLGNERFTAAWDAGSILPLEQTVRRAEELAAVDGEEEKQEDERSADTFAQPATQPPSHSVISSSTHNLHFFSTPIIGRAQALAEVQSLLRSPGVRLVTLVGPGGMGKTRLAVEVGQRILDVREPQSNDLRLASLDSESVMPAGNPKSKIQSLSWQEPKFPDGVWFVPLAAINTPTALPGAIASALGIALQGSDLRSALLQTLRQKHLMLILDNFEQLLAAGDEAVDLVVNLLEAVPGMQILVTSRERLKLHDEQIYTVPALTFTPDATLDEASSSSAVRLFVQAMQRVQGDFQLRATNLAVVLRICQLVQGMPLGLELAAANAGSAPLTAIADALTQSTEFLTVEWRDLPARQRSMRAVFAWSWQLLSSAEQRVLRQSTIFCGGFTYAAAQTVIGATLPLLTRLVDKSLLQWQASANGEGHYLLHELLRQFADEELQASGEAPVVAEQHGRYFLAYLAARGFRLGRHEPKEASAEIQSELDNVRQAWQWAATQGQWVELDQAAYAWWQFCQFQGLEAEGRQSFALAVASVRRQLSSSGHGKAATLLGERLLAKLLAIHANYLFAQGRDEEMAAQAREAMTLGAASGGFEGETFGAFVLGRALQDLEQKREAGELWRQTIELVHRHQPNYPENELLHEAHWMAHSWLRGTALHFGDYAGSRAYMVQGLEICRRLGKRRGELLCLRDLAEINFLLYDFVAAHSDFTAALELARTLHYQRVEMLSQAGLGELCRVRGDYTQARTLLEAAVNLSSELAFPYDEAMISAALIRLYCQLGNQTAAMKRYEQLTQLLSRVKLAKECQLYAYLAAALKAHYTGSSQEALRLAEQADQINQQGGDILFRLVDTALIVGHVRAAVGQWAEATVAYQKALAAFQQFNNQALAAEPQAGLAQIALAQGNLAGALAQVEVLLPVLAQQPHAGYNDPFFIYLTGYRVLVANGDPRAATLLQQGYDLLHQDAAKLDDESRQRFLAVPLHRDLIVAYTEMQARRDKVTRWQRDKVAESPSHPVTLSPLHPVTPSPLLDWAEMPAVDFFVERRAEVAQLTAWLTPAASGFPAQLISILGMGGMGKTTLAAVVTKAVAPSFAVIIWRSLLNAPPLNELLRTWLQTLSRQSLTALPESLDEQLRLLLSYLQQERCLLVLDNVESIFTASETLSRAGVLRPGYEGYDQLFQRLTSSEHQSCLLLTSREQPYALLRSGRQAQTTGRVQVLPLAGLDQQAGYALLQSNGLHASAAEAAQLVENYSGNPLALQIVAATIADFFGGNVAAFQQEEGQIFDGMRLVLDQQFARLSALERDILIWLAIEREAVTVAMLRSNFVKSVATASLLEALQALQNRSLLERRDTGLTLQNVIIEYTTDYLVEQVVGEILDFRVSILDSANDAQSKIQNLFLNGVALLKAQAKEYVRRSQSRLIVQPIITHVLERLGREGFEQRLRTLIGELRQQANRAARGYAAGNLLNLLLQAGCALNELDLSHLAVWQAYLRECTLHDVNFSGADMSGSEFADTFTAITILTYSRDGKFLVAGTSLGDIRVWLAQTLQPIALLQGHSRLVMGLAFGSQQSQLLTSCGEDGTLRLWNLAKPEAPSIILYQAPGFVRTVAVSPIADWVASAGDDPEIQLWDMQRQRAVAILRGHSNIVTSLVFSADGRYLASCSGDHSVRLWDLSIIEQSAIDQKNAPQSHPPVIEKSRIVYTWSPAAADVWQITISPDNQWLAGVNLDGAVWTWQIDAELTEKPVRVLQAQGAHQMAVSFSPDSSQVAVTALSGAIWLLDCRSGEIVRQIEGHKPLTLTLAFAPDGKTLASSGSDRTLRVWEVATGRSIQALAGVARAFRAAVFGADGKTIITSAEDNTIRIWDVSEPQAPEITPLAPSAPRITGLCRHVLRGHSSGIWTVALDHTCAVVASAGEDTNILLWDRNSGQQLHKFEGHLDTVTALAFSPDGRTLISGSPDQTVRLWDYRTFTPLAQVRDDSPSISTHEKSIWCVALSPDGAMLAAGYSDGGIVIWEIGDVQHCRQVGKLGKHEGWVRTLAFSPDGSLLASGSNDHTVRVWEVKSGSLRHVLHGHSDWVMSVAFHPHSNLLASGSFDNTIRLWDVATGEPIAAPTATPPMRHDKGVVAVTFHPAGHLLLSASRDERMTFWHCATQQRLYNLVAPGPYSGLKIVGATGLSKAQKATLRALGAVDEAEDERVTNDTVTNDTVTNDTVTNDTVTNDTGTESPKHLVTLSLPHPVTPSPLLDWGEMPAVDFFTGRVVEVAQLRQWLTPNSASTELPARLVSIVGIGGMGKTTLAAAITNQVAQAFEVVIWRSLLNASPFDDLLRTWLQRLAQQPLISLPDSLDEQLRLLLDSLRQRRCLLVLDNVESIFTADSPQGQAGVVRPGYEAYDQLFVRLANSDHQSCLLLTSREQPYALSRLGRQAQGSGGRIRVLPLSGLDLQAGREVLQSNGLVTSLEDAEQLIDNYSGNPLALQIVASTIADFFGGDVAAFQQEAGMLFDGMRLVLDQQFARLSPLEREILIWLAIERESIPVATLRANLVQPPTTRDLLEALQSLQNRSLLERNDAGLALQNVIIEYTTEHLIEQVCEEILDFRFEVLEFGTDNPQSKIESYFLNRFALLRAQAKEYVRKSQSRLILQPVLVRLLGQLGQAGFEQRLHQIIGVLKRRLQPTARGYAAGNLLNLLLHAGCDLKGLDLSHLAIWQAYLRECTLYDVNFSDADLSGSEFADTFATITTLTYSRDGRMLLGGTSIGDIRVWLASSLQPVAMLQGHSRIIMGLAVGSEKSQLLASCGEDGTVRLWNLANLDQPSTILYKTQGFVRAVAISPLADIVASAGDDPDIQLWDTQSRRLIAILRGHTNIITSLAFSPNGRYLASCSGDHTVRLWDVSAIYQSQPELHRIDTSHVVYTWSQSTEDVWVITISPNNQLLAGLHRNGAVWTWQIDEALTEKPARLLLKQGAHYSTLVFSCDSAQLAVAAASRSIWLLDSHSGEIVRQIEGHKRLTTTITFSPDGHTLASSGNDRVVRVWALSDGRSIQALAGSARAFRDAIFAADGQTLVTCAADRTIRIWEISETATTESGAAQSTTSSVSAIRGICRHILQGHSSGIWTVAVDSTSQIVASGGEDCNILLWDRHSGQLLHTLQGHTYTVTALAFSRDGQTLVSGSPDQTVRLWDYHTYTRLAQLKDDNPSTSVHEQSIWCVGLNPDGTRVAAGYSDGGIVIWDIRDVQHCKQLLKLVKHDGWVRKVAFSPDGTLLASASNDHTVRIWDVTSGALLHILKGHSDWVTALAFHPNGSVLASGGYDNTVRLWDIDSGQPIVGSEKHLHHPPMRHSKGVVSVEFHPHGHLLLSASQDARLSFWNWATQQRIHTLIAPGPYTGLNISGATGLSEAQKEALRALGAMEG